MAFSWAYFRGFGINYFMFADLTDFLLAAAREPLSLLAAAGGVLLIWLLYQYAEREYRWLESRENKGRLLRGYLRFSEVGLRSAWLGVVATALYVIAAVMLYGEWRANTLRDGEGTIVEARMGDEQPRAFLLMGSSARFVFLYDRAGGITLIVPDESVASLTVRRVGDD